MKLLSFVIPVYRNQGSIRPSYDKVVALMKTRLSSYDFEFVFIDDGSDDGSLGELEALHQQDEKVKVISFSRNFGQVPAIIAGLGHAQGDACICMSADLQEPVDLIERMAGEWSAGNQVVVCHRQERDDGFLANTASRLFYGMMKLGMPRMPEGGFDFVLLDRVAVTELLRIDERNRFFQGDILWLGFDVKLIPYTRLKRQIGKSQWTLGKKVKYFIDGVLNTSYLPIRLMSLLGLFTALAGFIYALVIVYSRLVHKTPFSGWAPIMILILTIGGLIMLMLGIIGEYVWRTYDESRKRPYFIIRKKYIRGK